MKFNFFTTSVLFCLILVTLSKPTSNKLVKRNFAVAEKLSAEPLSTRSFIKIDKRQNRAGNNNAGGNNVNLTGIKDGLTSLLTELNKLVAARGCFSFKRGNTKTYIITDDFRIRLTQIGAQLATLELVNQQRQVIPYPQGFAIRDNLYNEDVHKAGGVYVITWNASYTVSVKSIPRARLFNQRQVAVFKAHEGADGRVIADEPALEEDNVEEANVANQI